MVLTVQRTVIKWNLEERGYQDVTINSSMKSSTHPTCFHKRFWGHNVSAAKWRMPLTSNQAECS